MAHTPLGGELGSCGGAVAPASATRRLREVLAEAMRRGRAELAKPRSGYGGAPVEVGVALREGALLAALPVDAGLRADPDAASEREWLLVHATVATLVELACARAPGTAGDLALTAGELAGGFLVLALPAAGVEPEELDEFVTETFAGHVERIDRLRATAHALPGGVLDADALKAPIGETHPLRVAEVVARLGGRPQDEGSVEALEDQIVALLAPDGGVIRPHKDPDPARRVARRILQRLNGMGKWGGYHTEFAHLARGFSGNDRALAQEVGEALLASGLLAEKPSVGQRHVYLNPRRAGEIHRMIETGETPDGLRLPPG